MRSAHPRFDGALRGRWRPSAVVFRPPVSLTLPTADSVWGPGVSRFGPWGFCLPEKDTPLYPPELFSPALKLY